MGIGQNCHSSFLPLVQKAPLPVLGMDETKWICFAEVPCGVRATWLHSGKILGQAVEYVSQSRAFFFFYNKPLLCWLKCGRVDTGTSPCLPVLLLEQINEF